MSFGELASLPRSEESSAPSETNAATELRGHLRSLAANSASLRQWESADDAAEELRRVRTLRSQNRDLVRNSVALLRRLESAADADNADPMLRTEAEDLRELLHDRIEDFSVALRESIARERDAVAVAAPAPADISALPELGAARAPLSATQAGEDAPLLAVEDAREAALRRELAGTTELREQRVTALREIHTSVADVNDIMMDLASMIGDQATSLEFVAVNVEESFQSTAAAKRQLIRARKSRAQKRRLFFLALVMLACGSDDIERTFHVTFHCERHVFRFESAMLFECDDGVMFISSGPYWLPIESGSSAEELVLVSRLLLENLTAR
eukprot:IDg9835t1